MSSNYGRVINFGAGPSALPESVLEEAAKGLLNFQGTGIGIAEISHRSKEFTAFVANLESLIRKQLDVPPTHEILFTQGGGSNQFSAVVLNMLARWRLLHPEATEEPVLDYVLTGSWSKKAAEEARRLGGGKVNVVADSRTYSESGKAFDNIPPHDAFKFSKDPALIYYCENETVDGVEFSHEESSPASFPYQLLDQSTENNLLPLKNIGPAGLTVIIARKDCLVDVDAAAKLGAAPTLSDSKSLYNTPSVLSIYMTGLELNRRKALKVYSAIHEGQDKGVFKKKVKDGSESWMNVVFEVLGDGAEKKFLEGAEQKGLKGLKGHRSVGGIRVSLYNAVTEEQVDTLVKYMEDFVAKETKQAKAD
ncbi:pyridoxal phosphate-dependent transferase [Irpex lacteus]|nr:pyridoxal phosphate-dependent transferase [Irpex lacteus]